MNNFSYFMGAVFGLLSTLFVKVLHGEISYISILGMFCGLIVCMFIVDLIEKINKKDLNA